MRSGQNISTDGVLKIAEQTGKAHIAKEILEKIEELRAKKSISKDEALETLAAFILQAVGT